jgi:hypothetical protein
VAILFGLSANFGPDEAAARTAAEIFDANGPIRVRSDLLVGLHPAKVRSNGRCHTMLVLPIGVGQAVAVDRGHPYLHLTDAEAAEVAAGLYRLLACCTGYLAAYAGWEPDDLVDSDDLRREWADDLRDGRMPGLVLAEDFLADLRGPAFVGFSPVYVWLPPDVTATG